MLLRNTKRKKNVLNFKAIRMSKEYNLQSRCDEFGKGFYVR